MAFWLGTACKRGAVGCSWLFPRHRAHSATVARLDWPARLPPKSVKISIRHRHPDICVFDLDPSEEQSEMLSAAGIALRDLPSELGLESWVKTSGSKGCHVVAPLDGSADYGDVERFANAAGAIRSTSRRSSTKRIAVVEFSSIGAAMPITPPSRRFTRCAPNPGAPVSAPCRWDEIKNGTGPRSFLLRGMADRVSTAGDLWSEMLIRGQTLRPAIERLRRLQA
jgi:bifunctional non-homologous end joining protein LigD